MGLVCSYYFGSSVGSKDKTEEIKGVNEEMKMDWNTSTYFSQHEFKCSHTGQCDMNPEFIDKLNDLRLAFGKPMKITSRIQTR